MCSNALCTTDDASYFLVIRLGPKTSECEMNVIVKYTVTGCEVSNCAATLHGFNKHASSRREAVSGSRGVPGFTEKIYTSTLAQLCRSFDSSTSPYPLLVTPRVTRLHRTTCRVSSSQPVLFPYQASISFCGIAHVPAPSSRYRSGSHQS